MKVIKSTKLKPPIVIEFTHDEAEIIKSQVVNADLENVYGLGELYDLLCKELD